MEQALWVNQHAIYHDVFEQLHYYNTTLRPGMFAKLHAFKHYWKHDILFDIAILYDYSDLQNFVLVLARDQNKL